MTGQDFPRVFVISLAKDVGRRQTADRRLQEAGVPYEFFEAVDGLEVDLRNSPYYDGRKRRRYYGRDLLSAEIGCLLSHRGVYEKMERDNIDCAVVLEDDVILEKEFRSVVLALLNSKVPWDVVRFLGNEKIYKRGSRIIAPLVGRYSIARMPTTPGGAYGYMLTLKAARVLLKHMQRNWVPIDTLQGRCWETGLETLIVHPAPASPDSEPPSNIGDGRYDKTRVAVQGLERRLLPLFRFWLKLCETAGKRYVYYSAWHRDRRYRTA